MRLFWRQSHARDHQFECLVRADDRRQALRPAVSRKEAERDFGQSELIRALRSETKVASKRDSQSAAESMSANDLAGVNGPGQRRDVLLSLLLRISLLRIGEKVYAIRHALVTLLPLARVLVKLKSTDHVG
jgi:hypothetical protein